MLGFPSDVEEIYLGPKGLIASAKPGALLIDMTTSSPALARRIAAAAEEKKLARSTRPFPAAISVRAKPAWSSWSAATSRRSRKRSRYSC